MSKKVVIDIGHLGADSGAVANGHKEVDLNYNIANYTKEALNRCGIDVLMTDGSLADRCKSEREWGANCFVSIHNNAGGGDGTEVLYLSNSGKALAQSILDEIVNDGLNNSRGLKYRDNLYVLKNTKSPAALVECAFMDTSDIRAVDEVHERKAFGEAIAGGICKWLGVAYVAESAPAPTPTGNLVKITASVLNVRKGPGTNYAITTTVKMNEAYTIVDTSNGWGKLKSGAGWISLKYTKQI